MFLNFVCACVWRFGSAFVEMAPIHFWSGSVVHPFSPSSIDIPLFLSFPLPHPTPQHPDYGLLAARIAVSNLHKETKKNWLDVCDDLYHYMEPRTGLPAPLLSPQTYEIIKRHGETLNAAIVYDRDYSYDYFGFKTLERSYLLRLHGKVAERPQHMLMRVAVGIHGDDIEVRFLHCPLGARDSGVWV